MSCSHCGRCGVPTPLSETEIAMLELLGQQAFLPAARFLLRSRTEAELSFVMSAPVCILELSDTAEQIKETGRALLSLRQRGFITLDYGQLLSGFDYDSWKASRFYEDFAFSVDTDEAEPVLEPGSIALTLQGQEELDRLSYGAAGEER